MGNINIEAVLEESMLSTGAGMNGFTVAPGWPVFLSDRCYEGGIVCNMDSDGDLEIVFYLGWEIHALNLDGSYVPGWPQSTSYYSGGAPAYGDIDGDGDAELVVTNTYTMTEGKIHAYELDGTAVTGFPINHGYASRTPVLADLDGDGAMEIITNKRMWPVGEWWVYRGDGTVYPGWPQTISHVPAASSAVGDVNGDDIPEIIGESYDGIYAWDINGNLLPGFPFMMPLSAVNSYSSPVLADLDKDGLREIVFGTHVLGSGGYVFVLNGDGTQASGWPKYTSHWIYTPPAVGYIDGDDALDVAVGDHVLSGSPVNYAYAWNAGGTALSGFPIGPIWAINNQIALADLDGDGMMELLFDDNTMNAGQGKYPAYNHDGTPLAGFPLITQGSTFFNMTCLNDLDGDGYLDLVGAGTDLEYNNTYAYLWNSDTVYNPDKVTLPCFQYNVRHDGLYPPAATDTLVADIYTVPETGGTVNYQLTAGRSNANRTYLIVGGVTGTEPGFQLPGGMMLPINWDVFSDLVMALLNGPVFSNFMATLDSQGNAQAALNAPPIPPGFVGTVMYYAYTLNNPFDFVSNPVEIEIIQ